MSGAPRIVVVGGVAAGMSAASQVKRRQPAAEVVVFERGPYISYGACGMPYNIEDPARDPEDLVVLTPDTARNDRGLDVRLRHEVLEVDPDGGSLLVRNLEEGSEAREPFDALVIATGAAAKRLPIPGMDLPGVFVLRELTDGLAVKRLVAAGAERAVIVGAGYIGMEMAHVLTARGLAVTVLEKLPHLLPGWSVETVTRVGEELERHGVTVRTGVGVERFEAGTDGRAAAVIADGVLYPADLILVAAGVRPNVGLAAAAGLRLGATGAIWVNQYQQTSHEAVWSAGDCAEAYHRILRKNWWVPLGTTANKQGRVAGANVVGAGLRFAGIVGTAGFVTFELEVARSGLTPELARSAGFDPVSVVIRQRSRAHAYPGGSPVQVKLTADGPTGLLLGGELVGREGAALRTNALAAALSAHMSVADLQGLDFAYGPPFAPVWDPLLVAANQLAKKVGK